MVNSIFFFSNSFQLLQPLPENRFDFKEIIASAFFHTIDWSEVKRRGQI